MVKLILESISNTRMAAQVLRSVVHVSLEDALAIVHGAPVTLRNSYLPLEPHEGRGHCRFEFPTEAVEGICDRFASCAVIRLEQIPEQEPESPPVLMTDREAFDWIMAAFHEFGESTESDDSRFRSAVSDAIRAVRRRADPRATDDLSKRLRIGDKVRVGPYFRRKDSVTPHGLTGKEARVVWTVSPHVETDGTCPVNIKLEDGRVVQLKSDELELIG